LPSLRLSSCWVNPRNSLHINWSITIRLWSLGCSRRLLHCRCNNIIVLGFSLCQNLQPVSPCSLYWVREGFRNLLPASSTLNRNAQEHHHLENICVHPIMFYIPSTQLHISTYRFQVLTVWDITARLWFGWGFWEIVFFPIFIFTERSDLPFQSKGWYNPAHELKSLPPSRVCNTKGGLFQNFPFSRNRHKYRHSYLSFHHIILFFGS